MAMRRVRFFWGPRRTADDRISDCCLSSICDAKMEGARVLMGWRHWEW
jgi:hypothetical protein